MNEPGYAPNGGCPRTINKRLSCLRKQEMYQVGSDQLFQVMLVGETGESPRTTGFSSEKATKTLTGMALVKID